MNTKSITLAVAVAIAAAGTVAGASPGEYDEYYERRGPMPFEVLDRNGDGVVTAAEHAEARNERWSARTEAGYPMRGAGYAPAFEQIDSNGDGSVSPDELQAFHANRWQQRSSRGCPRN